MATPPDTPPETPPAEAVAGAVAELAAVLDRVADAPVWALDAEATAAALTRLTRVEARLAELQLRVAEHARTLEVGASAGATSVANWWAHTSRLTRPETHRRARLATALGTERHAPVRAALAAGPLTVDQARVVTEAIDALPAETDPALAERAARHLIDQAAHFDATALKVLGRRALEVIAPETADAHEAQLLDAEERAAAAATRLTLTDDGHGRSHGRFTLPTLHGQMLKKLLLALAAPQHTTTTTTATGTDRADRAERTDRAGGPVAG